MIFHLALTTVKIVKKLIFFKSPAVAEIAYYDNLTECWHLIVANIYTVFLRNYSLSKLYIIKYAKAPAGKRMRVYFCEGYGFVLWLY